MTACAVMAAGAWVAARGRLGAPAGVLGGGALAAISYRGIKSGIDVVVSAMDRGSEGGGSPKTRGNVAIGLVKFFTRYGILAVAAYVIMARLRLPPVAVFAGASSFVVALMVEAIRWMVRPDGPSAQNHLR